MGSAKVTALNLDGWALVGQLISRENRDSIVTCDTTIDSFEYMSYIILRCKACRIRIPRASFDLVTLVVVALARMVITFLRK